MLARIGLLLLLVAGCPQTHAGPQPFEGQVGACGSRCTLNADCNDFFSSCRYCNNGQCSALLPAQPARDAGVDTGK